METKRRGAGGTPGGIAPFFLGLIMTASGGYYLMNMITVSSGFWGRGFGGGMFGGLPISPFSVTLVVFLLGVGIMFFDANSKIGWIVAGAAFALMIIGVIATLRIHIMPVPLYVILIVLILLVGGIGLMARALLTSS